MTSRLPALFVATFLSLAWVSSAAACTLCCPVDVGTYADQMEAADVVVIAKVVTRRGRSCFDIAEVLKGKGLLKKHGDSIESQCLPDAVPGKRYLVSGSGVDSIQWDVPYPATRGLPKYLEAVLRLPRDKQQRIEFFYRHLNHKDEFVAADALDELDRIPVPELVRLKRLLNRKQIVAQLGDRELPSRHRRLLVNLLGICGTAADLPLLEGWMPSEEKADKRTLDATIATYLTLRGAAGLALIDELFISNRDADYAATYSAILALRYHFAAGKLPRQQVVLTLRGMLRRPELADLVMNDLTKAEDWQSMDDIMRLYRASDEKSMWIRVPAIHYLQSCPLPQAEAYLRECERLDPAAYARAYDR